MATHSSVLAWRIPGTGSLVGCHLWGRTVLSDQLCVLLYLSLNLSTQFGSRFSKIGNGSEGPVLLGPISPPLPPSLFRLMLPEEPPSAPPKNIVASGRTNQSIMVQWQPPPEPEHNGVLRGYVLRQVAAPGHACTLVDSPVSVLLRPQAQMSAGAQR